MQFIVDRFPQPFCDLVNSRTAGDSRFSLATKKHKEHKKSTVRNAEKQRTRSLRFIVERLSPTVLRLKHYRQKYYREKTGSTGKLATEKLTALIFDRTLFAFCLFEPRKLATKRHRTHKSTVVSRQPTENVRLTCDSLPTVNCKLALPTANLRF